MVKEIWGIAWNDGTSVGIPEVDEDEKRFIALLNRFNESVADRIALIEVKKRLQNILDDAEQHFAHEERLFKEWRYPDSDDHARKHAQVIQALKDIKENCISYDFDLEWIEAGLKIKTALINHILTEDIKYVTYYRSRIAGIPGKV
ncbi:MAG TPA: hemerythrin domain-containing protein [Gallionellaceae bacterium]|nr:hemerythrin domain-containing protein [Gallionellaceae bacterium]